MKFYKTKHVGKVSNWSVLYELELSLFEIQISVFTVAYVDKATKSDIFNFLQLLSVEWFSSPKSST